MFTGETYTFGEEIRGINIEVFGGESKQVTM
jgi:hypothetical protein